MKKQSIAISTNILILSIVLISIQTVAKSQDYPGYTLESLVELLGKSKYSPLVEQAYSDLYFEASGSRLYNKAVSLSFSNKFFEDKVNVVASLGIMLENVQDNEIPMLEDGCLGIEPYMSRGKADKVFLSIDPAYTNDGTSKAWLNYKEDYRIKVQFNGEKKSSKVLRMYVYLDEDKYTDYLKKDFMEYGVRVLIPGETNKIRKFYKDENLFLNVLPEQGCNDCLLHNNSTGKITFSDGSVYEGDFEGYLGSKGKLSFTYRGGPATYEGEFKNGLAHGDATITLGHGRQFSSKWSNGIIYEVDAFQRDGFAYTGAVSKDFLMNGEGTILVDGKSWMGKFKNDVPAGKTDFIIKIGGNVYKGWLNESLEPEGQGNWTAKDGQSYSGTFAKGEFLGGKGTVDLSDGARYTGQINAQMSPDGKGRYTYSNGNYIDCITKNGVISEAEGKKIFQDGSFYTGTFNTGMEIDGSGRITAAGGVYFEGKFSREKFMGGRGFNIYDDGSKYDGEIDSERRPHGSGTFTFSNKIDYIKGEFKDGILVPGHGYRKFFDGSSFSGILDGDGNPNGQGTIYNGRQSLKGEFIGSSVIGSVLIEENNGQAYEGPVDASFRPHGTGKFRRSQNSAWETGTFSHGAQQY